MKFATQIPSRSVVPFAMRLVQRSKREVFTTMDLVEEKEHPLPPDYHRLIRGKADSGLTIIRYGYGPKRIYKEFVGQYAFMNFRYGGSLSRYQRMILVDQDRGLFRLDDRVYYTTVAALVLALRVYVEGTV